MQRNTRGEEASAPLHTWHYEQVASPRGVCTAYPRLLKRMAEDFRKLAAKGSGQFGTAGLVNPSCPVCEVRWNAEDGSVSAMAQRLQKNPESASTVSVCVPHLQFLCNAIGNSSIRPRLLLREAAVMERTAEDMQRYAIKHDALRRHLASQEENAAPLLALQLLSGHRNVNAISTIREI